MHSLGKRFLTRSSLPALLLGGLLLLPGLSRAATPDPLFDLEKLLATPLNPRTTKTTEQDDVVTEEVMFHSEMDGEKSVDIFAFFSRETAGVLRFAQIDL